MPNYFIRRNQRILGPLTESQALELQGDDRILDTDEISNQTEGPWSNAKTTLTDIKKLHLDTNTFNALKQESSEPPDIPQGPPPFEMDLSNIALDGQTDIRSITSSFDEWVNEDVLALPPARYSEWQTPLEIKPTLTEIAKASPIPKKNTPLSSKQPLRNPLFIYLTIASGICCLLTLLVGILIGRSYSSVAPKVQNTEKENVVEQAYPQVATSANVDSFVGSHGKVAVYLNAIGNNKIVIDCRSGLIVDATWRSSSMKVEGFEIMSINTNTAKPGSNGESISIVRESLTQYLNAKREHSPSAP